MTLKIKRKNGEITNVKGLTDFTDCHSEHGCTRESLIWLPMPFDGWMPLKNNDVIYLLAYINSWHKYHIRNKLPATDLTLQFIPGPDVFTLCE